MLKVISKIEKWDFGCLIRFISQFNKTHEKMKLEVLRFSSQKDSTNGLLFDAT